MQAQSQAHARPLRQSKPQKKYDLAEALAQDADRVAAALSYLSAVDPDMSAADNALTYYEQLLGNSNLPTREVTIWSSTPSTPSAKAINHVSAAAWRKKITEAK